MIIKKTGLVLTSILGGAAAAYLTLIPLTVETQSKNKNKASSDYPLSAKKGIKEVVERISSKIEEEILQNCEKKDYLTFAAEGQDSKKIFTSLSNLQNNSLNLVQDFDYLEASRVNACSFTLDKLVTEGKLKCYVRHGGSNPEKRKFPTFFYAKDDDQDPVPEMKDYWAHRVTHAEAPKSKGLTGKGVRIGVLDTGVDPEVTQFKSQIKGFHDFVYNQKKVYDDFGHGTFVTGIINKVVPEAEIFVYKIHDLEGFNSLTNILEGFDQAIADNLDVLNNSWGLSEPKEVEGMSWNDANKVLGEALERVAKKGILIEASSGNDSYYTHKMDPEQLPCGSPYVISVGATTIRGEIADFSDLDAPVFAPGHFVYSTKSASENQFWSGTSFSGPFVAAALAVVVDYGKKHNHNFTYEEAYKIIIDSSRPESSTIVLSDSKEESYKFKMLDYKSLVDHLEKNY
ncbi:MAG: S8/S53 family peptidase [Nanoarchaeota archaeon]|nr:S8/S53 family peptidase [Nanoarchaeota archaeon]MBU1643872.1 S8/S53 family peptidase [Nanoarchaeota archaeon]